MSQLPSADLDTQVIQLKQCDGEWYNYLNAYIEKNSLGIMLCFMSRSALGCRID